MIELSVVLPVFNEEENIDILFTEIKKSVKPFNAEIIFVDDGSDDDSVKAIKKLKPLKSLNIKIIELSKNYGQTSAMSAGIQEAEGKYIALMDSDLQNDPEDIPKMLSFLKENKLDLVAGKRAKRKDKLISRKIPSFIANKLIYGISKIKVSDYGCSLKVMKAETAKDLELHGELHRFIPILASINGASIKEIEVNHRARKYGKSKYGLSRTLKVASDILLMAFFIKYKQKPMHLFGGLGITSLGIGSLIEFYLLTLKIFGENIGTRPLFYVGILLIVVGIQLITTGFLAELLMRSYYSGNDKKPYSVKKTSSTKKK